MPDEPIPAAADVWGDAEQAHADAILDETATGLDAMLRRAVGTDGVGAALTRVGIANVVFGDVTERRRQGVTFEDDAPLRERADWGRTDTEPVDPWTMRREYGLTEPLRVFSDWEEVEGGGVEGGNFGCRWPFNPCTQHGTWVRTVWLDAAPNLQFRIPFPALCDAHWMNRGQLTLNIEDDVAPWPQRGPYNTEPEDPR